MIENRCICPDPLNGRHDSRCMIHGWVCVCEITDRDERIWNRACPKHPRP